MLPLRPWRVPPHIPRHLLHLSCVSWATILLGWLDDDDAFIFHNERAVTLITPWRIKPGRQSLNFASSLLVLTCQSFAVLGGFCLRVTVLFFILFWFSFEPTVNSLDASCSWVVWPYFINPRKSCRGSWVSLPIAGVTQWLVG
jgi:hypothetical protein